MNSDEFVQMVLIDDGLARSNRDRVNIGGKKRPVVERMTQKRVNGRSACTDVNSDRFGGVTVLKIGMGMENFVDPAQIIDSSRDSGSQVGIRHIPFNPKIPFEKRLGKHSAHHQLCQITTL